MDNEKYLGPSLPLFWKVMVAGLRKEKSVNLSFSFFINMFHLGTLILSFSSIHETYFDPK